MDLIGPAHTERPRRSRSRGVTSSYRPERLFDAAGRLSADLRARAPVGARRMGANPHANGRGAPIALDVPATAGYAIDVPRPGTIRHESTRPLGSLLRDIYVRA
jgi:xylulose-5-phosphate/fructose-6-phosphate phosphoketolase